MCVCVRASRAAARELLPTDSSLTATPLSQSVWERREHAASIDKSKLLLSLTDRLRQSVRTNYASAVLASRLQAVA